MNEKRVQQIIEIEKQAQEILDSATKEAARLPVEAGREAGEMIQKAHASAEEEARQIITAAQGENEAAKIMAKAQEKIDAADKLATKNLERAVAYVLDRLAGKE
jgi:vacuolar-type H+-ATPase subunit H